MSTGKKTSVQRPMQRRNRFAELAKLGELVFHADDLANLWQIHNKNTLYTTLKRYAQRGVLFRIQKGLYSIKPPSAIDPYLLGIKALHGLAYVSTETVLANHGMIQQSLPSITLMSRQRKRFSLAGTTYFSRALPDQYLYQPIGITTMANGVRMATLERAIADLLYVNPLAYFDAQRTIDWKKVRAMQQAIGYPINPKPL